MRTLDLDIASSHCPLLSHPTRLQLSTAWLPRPVPPHSLASSHITALAGTEPGTRGPGSLAEVQPGAMPGPLISIDHSWGCTGLDPPCCTALGKLLSLPGVPKGLHKLMLGKPQAEGRSLSRLGLCGQLNKPQSPQLERPRRMMLTF